MFFRLKNVCKATCNENILLTTTYHDVGVGNVAFCVGVHVWLLTVVLTLGYQIGRMVRVLFIGSLS